MGSVVSKLRIPVDAGRAYEPLRTNPSARTILNRLEHLKLGRPLDALEGEPDVTRLRGGTSYTLAFGVGAGFREMRELHARP